MHFSIEHIFYKYSIQLQDVNTVWNEVLVCVTRSINPMSAFDVLVCVTRSIKPMSALDVFAFQCI